MNLMHCSLYLCIIIIGISSPLHGMQKKPEGIFCKIYRSLESVSAKVLRPNNTTVFMNDSNIITLPSKASNSITIYTKRLTGCISTFLFAKDIDSNKYALLTHFEPSSTYHKDHLMELAHQTELLKINDEKYNIIKFIIISPTLAYWDDKNRHDCHYTPMLNDLGFLIKNKCQQHHKLQILHVFYDFAPRGKGYTTDIYATLSRNQPSIYEIQNWSQNQKIILE